MADAASGTTRRPRRPAEVVEWLRGRPSLTEMQATFPLEWEQVQHRIGAIVRRGDPEEVVAYLSTVARSGGSTPGHARPQREVVAEAIRRQMTIAALRQAAVQVEVGRDVADGRLRMGLLPGWILQRLLFERGLRRKPARDRLVRLVWPLLPHRRRLMPLVTTRGIYCFYSRRLLRALAPLVGDRTCLEIAAGDGTLSRLLAGEGVRVTATDDHSWDIDDDGTVEPLDAVSALRTHRPEVVICSWPPPQNDFERHVFTTPSVRTYIVITTRQRFAAGDWDAYERQTGFDLVQDVRLGRYVLPPPVDGVVLVFRRRSAPGAG